MDDSGRRRRWPDWLDKRILKYMSERSSLTRAFLCGRIVLAHCWDFIVYANLLVRLDAWHGDKSDHPILLA
jgi:hypothetical protein